ncbi:MAG: hypothetical protein ABSA02_21885 [Trebonia sp.]
MSDIIDMLQALPHAITPGPAGPDLAAADVARGHRALGQRRRRRLAGVAGTAAVAAAAAVLAITSVPQPAEPARASGVPTASASRGHAAPSLLVTLAARIVASDPPLPGNASLEILTHTLRGKAEPGGVWALYTDSGVLYEGDDKPTLLASIAQQQNGALPFDSHVKAAAITAATGNLATARMQMIHASAGTYPEQYNNVLWTNAVCALDWAGASWKIRVGVLRLLSTIPGVTVADSTTGGRPTLTIASGPEVFGSFGTEVLIIDAETGLPISTASKIPGNPGGADYYRISRVTVANIKAGKF